MKTLIHHFLSLIARKSIALYEQDLMAKDDYIKGYVENVCIISKKEHFQFLADVVAITQRICSKNDLQYSSFINRVIECPKQYKSSFMAKAVCPEDVKLWVRRGPDDLKLLVAYFLNHALLAKEFGNGNPWIGIFDKIIIGSGVAFQQNWHHVALVFGVSPRSLTQRGMRGGAFAAS